MREAANNAANLQPLEQIERARRHAVVLAQDAAAIDA
jgi:hypothetical protein